MTREHLAEMGLTDEQIEKVIAENSKDVQKANAKADKYKADADKASELQKQLDEIENKNLSDIEKANKDLETANARIEELENKSRISSQKADAMAKFHITKEQADLVIGDDGSFNMDELGKIISEKETASANAKEQELAGNASNPNGGGASGGNDDDKSQAEKLAEKISPSNDSKADSVLSHYVD